MCGIFGGVGNYDPKKIQLLAILNESRGKDSAGFWNGTHWVKNTGPARDLISAKLVQEVSTPFIMGHTRAATRGSISKRNAHPFQFGNVMGMHNGVVWNFEELQKKYKQHKLQVDSEIIFWGLSKYGPDFLKELSAYWGLSWSKVGDTGKIYLSVHNGDLNWVEHKGAIYYSSSAYDLEKIGFKSEKVPSDKVHEVNTKTLKIVASDLPELQGYTRSDSNNRSWPWKNKWRDNDSYYNTEWAEYWTNEEKKDKRSNFYRGGTDIERLKGKCLTEKVDTVSEKEWPKKNKTWKEMTLFDMMTDISPLDKTEETRYLILDAKMDDLTITMDELDEWEQLEGRMRWNRTKEAKNRKDGAA